VLTNVSLCARETPAAAQAITRNSLWKLAYPNVRMAWKLMHDDKALHSTNLLCLTNRALMHKPVLCFLCCLPAHACIKMCHQAASLP
jgi:hypothetical protein